jgi:polyisoprenoid-binding protein YceI
MQWTIDTAHSQIEFRVKHLMVSTIKGYFDRFSGNVSFDPANPISSQIEVSIETASVNTHDTNRDAHLILPEFFDKENYPTIGFRSLSVEKVIDEQFKVRGELTIKNVTREVILEVDYAGQTKNPITDQIHAGFSATTTINRKDFGLNWNVALEAGGVMVSDRVTINLDIQLVPALVAQKTF